MTVAGRWSLVARIAGAAALAAVALRADVPPSAFPGAEGFGAHSVGGRGGRVIYVRNLNDAGPGSFRFAATAAGPRTVVFAVGGIDHTGIACGDQ